MKTGGAASESIDAYIAGFRPEVRAILEEIRRTIRAAAPDAEEAISYRMAVVMQSGPTWASNPGPPGSPQHSQ